MEGAILQKYIGVPDFYGIAFYHSYPIKGVHLHQIHMFITSTDLSVAVLYYIDYPRVPKPQIFNIASIYDFKSLCETNNIPTSADEQERIYNSFRSVVERYGLCIKINKVTEI